MNAQRPRRSGAAAISEDQRTTDPDRRLEASLVAGLLLHPEQLERVRAVVEPADIEDPEHRELFRDILAAYAEGYFNGRTGITRGYEAVGAYLLDHGRWTGRLFAFGDVDSFDPVGAARLLAERTRRRNVAARLAAAAEAVAAGHDPDTVLAGLAAA